MATFSYKYCKYALDNIKNYHLMMLDTHFINAMQNGACILKYFNDVCAISFHGNHDHVNIEINIIHPGDIVVTTTIILLRLICVIYTILTIMAHKISKALPTQVQCISHNISKALPTQVKCISHKISKALPTKVKCISCQILSESCTHLANVKIMHITYVIIDLDVMTLVFISAYYSLLILKVKTSQIQILGQGHLEGVQQSTIKMYNLYKYSCMTIRYLVPFHNQLNEILSTWTNYRPQLTCSQYNVYPYWNNCASTFMQCHSGTHFLCSSNHPLSIL